MKEAATMAQARQPPSGAAGFPSSAPPGLLLLFPFPFPAHGWPLTAAEQLLLSFSLSSL
jgi:hypothetical protein